MSGSTEGSDFEIGMQVLLENGFWKNDSYDVEIFFHVQSFPSPLQELEGVKVAILSTKTCHEFTKVLV